MSLHFGNSAGGQFCGCCCSYSAESFNTASSSGRDHTAPGGLGGDCCASCANGDAANMNANLVTAINRTN